MATSGIGEQSAGFDTTRPHPARTYDYLLGGKDNFAVDREAVDKALQKLPTARVAARENRAFLGRVVRFLVQEAGIRQFLDIGTGLPTVNPVHQVAQSLAPECRVVYVDNDPIVLAHARALLTSTPPGKTAYIDADLRDPERILAHPELAATLDLTRPVALMLVAILHFLGDEDDPASIVATLLGALPSGSYLASSHVTAEYHPQAQEFVRSYRESGVPLVTRTTDEFADLAFEGLEMVDPGVVLVSEWHPDETGPRPLAGEVNWNGGVARKP